MKQQKPGEISPEMKAAVLYSMARKAAAGSVTAARIILDEYTAQHGGGAPEADFTLLEAAFEEMKASVKDDGRQI